MKRPVCCCELGTNIGIENVFRVLGGSEFQSRGPITENIPLLRDVRTYGMEIMSESDDFCRHRMPERKVCK